MPNGDQLTQNGEFQLEDFLFGVGSNYVYIDGTAEDGIKGLFDIPDAKTQDVNLPYTDGVYANVDYMGLRTLTIPIVIRGAAPTVLLGDGLSTVYGAWAPRPVDVDLWFQVFDTSVGFMGRPRGMTTDLSKLKLGAIRCLLRFDCPNPNFV